QLVENMKLNQEQLDTNMQLNIAPKVQLDQMNLNLAPLNMDLHLDIPPVWSLNDSDLTDGAWYASTYNDRISFDLRVEDDDHSWNSTMRVDKSEINPFPGQGQVSF